MTGAPAFQYKIPYEEWYFIVTSSGLHFYFNKSKRKSYWQLYDIFQDNACIDKNEFLNCIKMEDVAVLMSRLNGLKGLDGYFFKGSKGHEKDLHAKSIEVDSRSPQKETEEEAEEAKIDQEGKVESEEQYEEETVEYDKDAKDEFIRNLLLEEGYIKDQTEKKDEEPPGGLDLGYSSSENESEAGEDEDIENNQDDDNDVKPEVAHNGVNDNDHRDANEEHDEEDDHDEHEIHDADDSDDEIENNLGLDLSLSDDEADFTQDFLRLLDSFKNRISIYDPWFLIEEELLPELITKPEYYSIDDSTERENIFNKWCKVQHNAPQDSSANVHTEKQSCEVYPTVTQMYFKYLQSHKKELKKFLYSEFITKFSNEIDLSFGDLSLKERESLYRQYKMMITDFAEYEKKMKKSSLNDANMKKLKLEAFLNKNSRKLLPNDAKREELLEIEKSTEDAFSKWVKVCNLYKIPTSMGNNVENFIVGNEKRLQSYIDMITRS